MNTQKIKKSDLKIIYENVCEYWQKILQDLILWSESSEIEISNDLIQKGYNEANDKQKKLIEKYFKLENSDILSKIKDFKDILKLSNKTLKDILPYQKPTTENQVKINALAKIQLIEEVVNEGWKPNWSNSNEYKHYIWFEFKKSVGWVVCAFADCCFGCGGEVAFYKSKKISHFVSKTFLKEYREFLTGKIEE
jgi:hypothetical protein